MYVPHLKAKDKFSLAAKFRTQLNCKPPTIETLGNSGSTSYTNNSRIKQQLKKKRNV